MKHWPANMWVQTPVEIIKDMSEKYGFGPDDVEEIVVDPPVRGRMWAPDEGFACGTPIPAPTGIPRKRCGTPRPSPWRRE